MVWKDGNFNERNMKRIYFLIALLVIATSCQVDNIIPDSGNSDKGIMEFEAHAADTRSVLNDMTPEWSKNETIYVFNNATKEIFTGQNTVQTASTKFKGAALDGKAFIAVSPSTAVGTSALADVAKKTVTAITIPTEQNAIIGTYDPRAFVAVAYTEDDVLRFDSAVSLLKFKMGSDNVTEVTFAGWNGENLSGTGNVSYNSEGMPEVAVNTTYVKLKGQFKKGSIYYVAVAPNTFSKGLICEFGLEKVRVTESSIVLKPNQITDLGEISFSNKYLKGGFDGWGNGVRMCKVGDWYAAYSVQVMNTKSGSDEGFKFVDGTAWIGGKSNISLYDEYATGSNNITISGDKNNAQFKETWFDVFYNPTTKKYKVRAANERETRDVTLTIKNSKNWSKLYVYSWYWTGSKDEYLYGSWPGQDITTAKKIIVPKKYFGKQIYFIVNNNSGQQTSDLGFFVAGDYEYELK